MIGIGRFKMNLQQAEEILKKEGLETETADNILTASRNLGGTAVEVTLDAGGGCLIKKIAVQQGKTKKIVIGKKQVYEINENQKVSRIRVKMGTEKEIIEVIKYINS